MKKRHVLLTPGPTPLAPDVIRILTQPLIYHRTAQFRSVIGRVSGMLRDIFQTKNDVYILTSSGTGAMEAAAVNFLSPGDKVVIAHAGKFGERWVQLAKQYGYRTIEIKAPYAHAVESEKIAEALAANPDTKAVFTTLCETSTGVTHNIEAMARIVRPTHAILIVDAISGLLSDALPQDEWGVDVVLTGSQKGLAVPPGLAFISVSQKAWQMADSSTTKKYYYDLKLYKKNLATQDTPFTPAVNLVLALEQSLGRVLKKGLSRQLSETARLARATREALKAIGLVLFPQADMSNGLTAVNVPANVDGGMLVKTMREKYGVTVAGGQGEMKGKIFRIAHMGCISKSDLTDGLRALCAALNGLGYSCDSKKALSVFRKALVSRTGKQKTVTA